MSSARYLAVLVLFGCSGELTTTTTSSEALVDAAFRGRGLAGKCIAVDTKSRVELRTCADVPEQRIRVVEYDERLVELRVADRCIQPLSGFAIEAIALETAPCTGSAAQRWMLDGDTIRLGPQKGAPIPNLVVAVHDHSGGDGSPLHLEARRFDDSDYWELTPLEKGLQDPTSGFVHVATYAELAAAIDGATPGSVVDIDAGAAIDLYECGNGSDHTGPRFVIGDRVTVRSGAKTGGFRPLHAGAQLHYKPFLYCLAGRDNYTPFYVDGEGARMTGFRLEGLSTSADDGSAPRTYGILVHAGPAHLGKHVEIDHVELTGWKEGAVGAWSPAALPNDNGTAPTLVNNSWIGGDWHPLQNCSATSSVDEALGVTIAHNYIHHNRDPSGYGVAVTGDGHAQIVANTFLHNRHAISATGTVGARYRAEGNLVHSHGEDEQDFDVHGSAGCVGGARGGVAGERIEVLSNTFLGDDRNNFYLRGTSCRGARFARNVTRQQEDAVFDGSKAVRTARCPWEASPMIESSDNRYEISDPTANLVVGDFNGDGRDDVFMATGAASYVSYDGQSEWQLRAFGAESVDDLRFGDFDGDGRTDLLRDTPKADRGLQIRFGGEGDWIPLRPDLRVADIITGDFDGDGRSDLLVTTGSEWKLASHAGALLTTLRSDSRPASALRAGHLVSGTTTDDVIAIEGDKVVAYVQATFGPFIAASSFGATIDQLAIADLTGDGAGEIIRAKRAFNVYALDVLHLTSAETFTTSDSGKRGALGRFAGPTAVALVWNSLGWRAVPLGGASLPLAWFEMF